MKGKNIVNQREIVFTTYYMMKCGIISTNKCYMHIYVEKHINI